MPSHLYSDSTPSHISVTILDQAGNPVSTPDTFELSSPGLGVQVFANNWGGQVNLTTGSTPLAAGVYDITIRLEDRFNSTTFPFDYTDAKSDETISLNNVVVGSPVVPTGEKITSLSWVESTEPANADRVQFKFRTSGTDEEWQFRTVVANSGQSTVAIENLLDGDYDYEIQYFDADDRIIKSTTSMFSVSGAGTTNDSAIFSFDDFQSSATTGISIDGYIEDAAIYGDIEKILVNVYEAGTTNLVPNATDVVTIPDAHSSYSGKINLSVGSTLATGRYDAFVSIMMKSGEINTESFFFEVGTQPAQFLESTITWDRNSGPPHALSVLRILDGGEWKSLIDDEELVPGVYQVVMDYHTPGVTEYVIDYLDSTGEIIGQVEGSLDLADGVQSSNSSALIDVSAPPARQVASILNKSNQEIFSVDAAGAVVQREYTPSGQVNRETAYATLLSPADFKSIYDAEGDARETILESAVQVSPDDRVTRYFYDRRNDLIAMIAPDGVTTSFERDPNGNVVREIVHAQKASIETLDLENDYTVSNYFQGEGQNANHIISADGSELSLSGNIWKQIFVDYEITPNTVIEFDFFSDSEGQIQGISFSDATNKYDSMKSFQLFGNQPYARTEYQYEKFGEYQHFEIPIGEYFYEGESLTAPEIGNYLGFANDDDRTNPQNTAKFKNIRLYEAVPRENENDQVTHYVYDNAGRMSYAVDPEGAVTGYRYDGNGNELSRTEFATSITIARDKTELREEVAKLLTSDLSDRISYQYFDAGNRVIGAIDPEGTYVTLDVNAHGEVTRSTSYSERVTEDLAGSLETGLGVPPSVEVTTPTSPNHAYVLANTAIDRTNHSVYDSVGRMVASVDGEGAVSKYFYNEKGELISEEILANKLSPSEVLALGSQPDLGTISTPPSAKDRKLHYFHDRVGRLLAEVDAENYFTTNKFNSFGETIGNVRYAEKLSLQELTDAVGSNNFNEDFEELEARRAFSLENRTTIIERD
ncbi:MAG: hypothetical protein AAF387_20675, partial [Pseudomonadota bacterium]